MKLALKWIAPLAVALGLSFPAAAAIIQVPTTQGNLAVDLTEQADGYWVEFALGGDQIWIEVTEREIIAIWDDLGGSRYRREKGGALFVLSTVDDCNALATLPVFIALQEFAAIVPTQTYPAGAPLPAIASVVASLDYIGDCNAFAYDPVTMGTQFLQCARAAENYGNSCAGPAGFCAQQQYDIFRYCNTILDEFGGYIGCTICNLYP